MELATIKMPQEEAQRAFEEYRAAVRERHDEEDEQIMRGYKVLAQGQQVLNLPKTLVAGGVEELRIRSRWTSDKWLGVTLPRLAVARANRTTVWTSGVDGRGACAMQTKRQPADSNRFDVLRLPAGTFEAGTPDESNWNPRIRAVVPNVPPRLRPRIGIHNFHVLFEAEWGLDPEPPIDPALLRHIGGDLYAVVAVWDLTELESGLCSRAARDESGIEESNKSGMKPEFVTFLLTMSATEQRELYDWLRSQDDSLPGKLMNLEAALKVQMGLRLLDEEEERSAARGVAGTWTATLRCAPPPPKPAEPTYLVHDPRVDPSTPWQSLKQLLGLRWRKDANRGTNPS